MSAVSARAKEGAPGRSPLPPKHRLELVVDRGSLRPFEATPGVGVVAATGCVDGHPVLCYAQDAAVAGGSVGEAEAEVMVAALRRSRELGLPLISFVESAGARLQEGGIALGAYGRVFFENVGLSRHAPQISIISGTSAGGGCYSPALTDFVVMTKDAKMFLTGPTVVNEVMHESVTAEVLGGSRVQERNGVCHFAVEDDAEAAAVARLLLRYLPHRAGESPLRVSPAEAGGVNPAAEVPIASRRVYDIRAVAGCIVDGGEVLEVSRKWAPNLVTAFAHLAGRTVGLVANQPKYLGGALDIEASRKGASFVELCDDFHIPLVVLVDTPGFIPGTRQEAGGVISYGAQLVHAFAAARVPRITVIVRKAYGGAYIAMNAKSLGADLVLAWPGAEIGIMGSRPAAQILYRREIAAARNRATAVERLAAAYARRHVSTVGALRGGLVDRVIEPAQTRDVLVAALSD